MIIAPPSSAMTSSNQPAVAASRCGIGQQFLRRIAAAAAGMQLPQVAQHAVKHEGHAGDQAARAVQGNGLGADGVQRVGNHRAGRSDADELVEHGRRVMFQHAAMPGAVGLQGVELGTTLGEAEEQGQHQAAQQQPLRRRDAQAQRAGQDAQHETGGDDEHVEDHHVLESEAVADIEQHVGGKDPRRRAGPGQAMTPPPTRQASGQRLGQADAHRAGRQRPRPSSSDAAGPARGRSGRSSHTPPRPAGRRRQRRPAPGRAFSGSLQA
jgi:hypothetical protein